MAEILKYCVVMRLDFQGSSQRRYAIKDKVKCMDLGPDEDLDGIL